ncbi:kinesin-like protein KIF17 isoform X4 [Agelaius tricolor]|uniref:kinesin-like protein KIF17 isoform X4 n=1 Tax=Agelaius tricolor TaxID=9191 RepID=UPI0039F18D22
MSVTGPSVRHSPPVSLTDPVPVTVRLWVAGAMAAEPVKVAVRCRPLSGREAALGHRAIVHRGRGQLTGPVPGAEPRGPRPVPRQFSLDGAFGGEHSTERIYSEIAYEHIYSEIAYPLVEGAMEGYNGTIFACGQTGSGKSFTMQGVADSSSQKGTIPRAFEHIFESVQCAENTKLLLGASCLEIYREDIGDLLGADTKQKLERFQPCHSPNLAGQAPRMRAGSQRPRKTTPG